MKTLEQLLAQSEQIKGNTLPNSNTANLVGDTLKGIVKNIQARTDGPVSGFLHCESIDELPVGDLTPVLRRTAYIISGHIYLYVGTGGDTLDGLYQDCGALEGPAGPQGPKGNDGVVLDGVNTFNTATDVEDKTDEQKSLYVPTALMIEELNAALTEEISDIDGKADDISAELEDTRLDMLGGTRTETGIDGKQAGNYSSASNFYIRRVDSTGAWQRNNHTSTYNYVIRTDGDTGIKRIEGKARINATPGSYTRYCLLSFYKTAPWTEEEWPDTGEWVGLWPGGDNAETRFDNQQAVGGTDNYHIAPASMVVGKSSSDRYFDVVPPATARGVWIFGYGNSYITITLTRETHVAGISTQVSALDSRVTALESAIDPEEDTTKAGLMPPDNDQDCLLLRRYIKDNWPYYLTSPSTPLSYDDMNYLEGKIKNIPEGKHFIFITDTHWKDNPAKRVNWIASYVQKRLGGCTAIFGGDAVNNASTKYLAAKELSDFADEFFAAFGDNGLFVCGNHDANYVAYNSGSGTGVAEDLLIDDREIYRRTVAPVAHKVVADEGNIAALYTLEYVDFDPQNPTADGQVPMTDDLLSLGEAWLRLHYHCDDHRRKIRYIVVETGNGGLATRLLVRAGVSYMIPLQLAWMADTLLSTPDDYDIVVVGHEWTLSSDDSDARNMLRMLYYFQAKSSVSINMRSQNTTETTKRLPRELCGSSQNRSFDFSSSTHQGRLIIVGGHYHRDRLYQFQYENSAWALKRIYPEPDEPPVLNTRGVLYAVSNTDNATRLGDSPDVTNEGRPVSPSGTTDEVCFDVYTLTADNRLVCTRFGWGEDREARIPC